MYRAKWNNYCTRELREVTQDGSNTHKNKQMQYITEFRSFETR